ncbi:putative membrane protein [Methylobacterium persicinum]|uniref:Membrane protein n=2 Tax=Methylobacterium persicinum TaxID=374426 RepID=A0ABU0HSL8_9HYPH|nr:putative membrane protein [Methylobacterium persicinum]
MAALFTDSMYLSNALIQWANFSAWLITGGLVLALIAALVLVLDFLLGRAGTISWPDFGLLAVAAILSIVNVFIHTRDGWTSVVPSGITVSAIVAILLLIAGLRGWCATGLKMPARGDNA